MSTPTDPQNPAPEPGEGSVPGNPPPPYGAQPPPYGAQPPAYGYGGQPPAYGYGGGSEKNNLGTWALVLGILSIVCCGFFTGIPAVIVGNNSKKAAAQGLANNGNLGNIGMILGWVGIGLSVIALIWRAANGFNYSYQFGNN